MGTLSWNSTRELAIEKGEKIKMIASISNTAQYAQDALNN